MIETSEAIVLNARKFGETSKIVSFFTKEFGKINAMVKGAQKPKSKFGSTLEPMNYVSINFYKKPSTQLQLLSESEIVINFWNIRTSLEHTAMGFAIVETLYKILEEHYVNKSVFEDIVLIFEELNKIEEEPFRIFVKFLFNFALNLGIDINISNELLFQEHRYHRVLFDYENGTFQGDKINSEDIRYYIPLDDSLYKKLNEVYNAELGNLPKVHFSRQEVFKIVNLFNKFFGYHTEKSLFLESLGLIY